MAKASAELLHQKGADVAILDLPASAGADVAKELGGTFHPVDIRDDTQVRRQFTMRSMRSGDSTLP